MNMIIKFGALEFYEQSGVFVVKENDFRFRNNNYFIAANVFIARLSFKLVSSGRRWCKAHNRDEYTGEIKNHTY